MKNFLTATILIYTKDAGITKAAGIRLVRPFSLLKELVFILFSNVMFFTTSKSFIG